MHGRKNIKKTQNIMVDCTDVSVEPFPVMFRVNYPENVRLNSSATTVCNKV